MQQTIIIHSKDKGIGKVRYTIIAEYIGSAKQNEDGSTLGIGPYTVGVALCGEKDQFDRKIGRKIAAGRALKDPIAYVEDRQELFDQQEFIAERAKEKYLNK